LIGIERATRSIKGRVSLAVGVIGAAFVALSLVATRSPFALIATGFTLDPWTGYYRLLIWEHGLWNVWWNPWMGLGLNDWVRPDWMASPTVDAFWLVIAMRGGFPSFILLMAAIVFIARGVVVGMRGATRDGRTLATGWMISLIALSLVGCTVHYWNVPYAYFFFFLGLGGCLADPLRQTAMKKANVAMPQPAPRVRWIDPEGWTAAPDRWQHPRSAHYPGCAPAPRWPVPATTSPVSSR
jgi:hypothetical protein